jgi:hypothetical protein
MRNRFGILISSEITLRMKQIHPKHAATSSELYGTGYPEFE